MKSLLTTSISTDALWEFSYLLIALYLILHPALAHPQSFAVALGGGLVLLLLRRLPEGSFEVLGFPCVLFLVFCLLSAAGSISPGITLQSAGFLFSGTLLFLMARKNDLPAQNRLEMIFLLIAAAASFLGFYQWLFGFENLSFLPLQLKGEEAKIVAAAVHDKRASGPFVTSGALAAFLILMIPQAFIRAWTAAGVKKYLLAFLTLVLLAGLFSTGSVGAWLCLTAGVLLVLLWRGLKAPTLVIFGLGFAAVLGMIWHRGEQSWLLASFSMRLELWNAAWQLFLKNPFWGTGLGTFGEAYQSAGAQLGTGSQFAHNLFFQLLVETGLCGTFLFAWSFFNLIRRLQWSSRWEGWGAAAGAAAFFLFAFLDIPFVMPELIWIFPVAAARLSLRPGKFFRISEIPPVWLEWGVLGCLLLSGFWPPFRPWNFALLAGVLWLAAGYSGGRQEKVSLWVFAGFLYIGVRAFVSPSAMGAVRFLEMAGLVLAFILFLRNRKDQEKFLFKFYALGIFFAARVWWLSFESSDIRDWTIFPNPKQVGIFLLPLLFLWCREPFDLKAFSGVFSKKNGGILSAGAFLFSMATLACLKAFSAGVGFVAGLVAAVKKNQRAWMLGIGFCLVALLLIYRVMVFRTLDQNPTQWDRVWIWKSAVQVWSWNPLTGVGPGAFGGYYDQVKSPRESGINRYLMDARYTHNEYLEFLTAFGLIGFLWALGSFVSLRLFSQGPRKGPALTGLAVASFVDFCLHTPLILLQAVGLMSSPAKGTEKISWAGGFLALGLVAGLFGAAAAVPILETTASDLKAQGRYPEALRKLETAARLNAWDARVMAVKAGFLEDLYRSTGDTVWKRKSDEAYSTVLELEQTEGQWAFENAQRLTRRLELGNRGDDLTRALEAWGAAEKAMPFNAFVRLESGLFHLRTGEKQDALSEFQKAVELEPRFAAAWINLGIVLKSENDFSGARAAFQQASDVESRWKNADRIDPLEKQLVSLPPQAMEFLRGELSK